MVGGLGEDVGSGAAGEGERVEAGFGERELEAADDFDDALGGGLGDFAGAEDFLKLRAEQLGIEDFIKLTQTAQNKYG